MGQAERVRILHPDPGWSDAFERVGRGLREFLGGRAVRIDHIGSTSVPGLGAKDVIDIQVAVGEEAMLEVVPALLEERGWTFIPAYNRDHPGPGVIRGERAVAEGLPPRTPGGAPSEPAPAGRRKGEPALRAPLSRLPPSACGERGRVRELQARTAEVAPSLDAYADLKDPACDLIYLAAEEWAAATSWSPSRSDV